MQRKYISLVLEEREASHIGEAPLLVGGRYERREEIGDRVCWELGVLGNRQR
jgi:hypothetical protein